MRAQDLLADSVLSTKALLGRYLAGFDDSNHTRQAPSLPNHAAWNLGHLALTMHRVAGMLDGGALPPDQFAAGRAREAFDPESVSFGSAPTADAGRYPPMARSRAIFETACDRLGAAVRGASDAKLAEEVAWGQGKTPLHALVARMVFHNGMHTGQIADLRRALGMGSIFA